MRVTIPDDLLDPYVDTAAQTSRSIDEVVSAQLKRFATLQPTGQRAVLIPESILPECEAWLGKFPLKDGADLLDRLRKHGQITFSSIDIQLSHGQRVELQHRAIRQGKTVEALIREMAEVFMRDFFWSFGGGEAAPAPTQKAG